MLTHTPSIATFTLMLLCVTSCNTSDPEFNAPVIPERIAFSASRQYPEGITYAPSFDKFLVSSVTQGKVGTVDQNGRYADFVSADVLISGIGLKVNGNQLYVCNSDQGVSEKSTPKTILKTAGLLVFDLASRQLVKAVSLDSLLPGVDHFANDMAFDTDGNTYITDSFAPVIYKVTPDFKASILVNDPQFLVEGIDGVNLNGIVYHPGKFLIVVKSNEGKLFKVDLNSPGKVTQVTGNFSLPGGDGMVLYNNDLYVVNGRNKVTQLSSSDGWKTAAVVKTDAAGYEQATTNVVVNDKIYTLNARIGEVNDAAMQKNPAKLQASEYSIQQFK
ncbi:gluconolaconase [Spirosoma areae]